MSEKCSPFKNKYELILVKYVQRILVVCGMGLDDIFSGVKVWMVSFSEAHVGSDNQNWIYSFENMLWDHKA